MGRDFDAGKIAVEHRKPALRCVNGQFFNVKLLQISCLIGNVEQIVTIPVQCGTWGIRVVRNNAGQVTICFLFVRGLNEVTNTVKTRAVIRYRAIVGIVSSSLNQHLAATSGCRTPRNGLRNPSSGAIVCHRIISGCAWARFLGASQKCSRRRVNARLAVRIICRKAKCTRVAVNVGNARQRLRRGGRRTQTGLAREFISDIVCFKIVTNLISCAVVWWAYEVWHA